MRKFHFRDDVLGEKLNLKPVRATKFSAGYDLKSAIDVIIYPRQTVVVSTGVTVEMNDNDVVDIRSKSGLAAKHSIFVLNSPGTIDADYYPNEIQVILCNAGVEPYHIHPGDKIAQALFTTYNVTDDDEVSEVERTGGLGSTGK